jgi:hypothetical protein
MTRTPTYADIVFGNQRPDTVIIDKADKTVLYWSSKEQPIKKPSRKGRGDSISTAPHAAKSNSLVPRAKGQPEEPLNYDFALSSGAGT